jgi:tRNA(fMet)-specific endonuclease VapC
MSASVTYLLDTNVVLALLRMNAIGKSVEATYQLQGSLSRSLISVVTAGEMRSLSRQFGWGQAKLDALDLLLRELVWIEIGNALILDAYGELDHESQRAGRRTMGKNDVWIAATAKVTGATLLTTHRDFDHLHGTWINRIWIDPNTGKT